MYKYKKELIGDNMAKPQIHTELPPRNHPDYMKLYRQNHISKTKEKEYRETWKNKNPNYYKENYDPVKSAKWREENQKYIRETAWIKYGIKDFTYEQYQQELEKQGGKCLICKEHMTKPQVDHDHTTGKYRGILCVPCNNGLGIYENRKTEFETYLQKLL